MDRIDFVLYLGVGICLSALILFVFIFITPLGMYLDALSEMTTTTTVLKVDSPHAWTKAVFNGTHIQDYYIECDGSLLVRTTSVGRAVRVPENWTDPRPVEIIQKIC